MATEREAIQLGKAKRLFKNPKEQEQYEKHLSSSNLATSNLGEAGAIRPDINDAIVNKVQAKIIRSGQELAEKLFKTKDSALHLTPRI